MSTSQTYIAVAVAALAVVALLLFPMRKRGGRISQLAGVAFGFITAGVVFGDNKVVGYGLMGTGVLLAVIDVVRKSRNARVPPPRGPGSGGPARRPS